VTVVLVSAVALALNGGPGVRAGPPSEAALATGPGLHGGPRTSEDRKELPFYLEPKAVLVHYGVSVTKKGRAQVSVELAPNVKNYLEGLVADGQELSVQDFVRRAIQHEIALSLNREPVPKSKPLSERR